jgi:hypothetical protein
MRVAGSVVVALCAACYAPSPQPGAPCANGACPTGLICASATQTCELAEPIDAAVLADDDAPAADAWIATGDGGETCYGTGLVTICPAVPITMPVAITANTTINTETSPLCIAYSGGSENAYCVIAATTFSIAQNRKLRATGTRPLVVLATGAITMDGTLDVSAGAATNPFACVAPVAATGAQGGAGGSFRGRGGSGAGAVNGLGPASAAATTNLAFRGGCDGGKGGGGNGGAGGSGGGAMYLIGASISISGTLDANGAGGARGTNASGGGGGGGAGGFIGLDATSVIVADGGSVIANGGGGGEGATRYRNGSSGSTGGNTRASGGSGGAPHGGDGGDGSFGAALDGDNGDAGGSCGRDSSSGGGGGGGAGTIYVVPAQTLGGTISPPPV